MGSSFSRKLCPSAHIGGQVLTSEGQTCSQRRTFTRCFVLLTDFGKSIADGKRLFQASKCQVPSFSVHSHPSVQNRFTLQLIYHQSSETAKDFASTWCASNRRLRPLALVGGEGHVADKRRAFGCVIASRLAVDLLEVHPTPTLYLIDAKHFVATIISIGVKADMTDEAIVVHTLHGIKQRVASDLPSSTNQGFDRLNDHHGSIVGIRAIDARRLACKCRPVGADELCSRARGKDSGVQRGSRAIGAIGS